MPEVLAESLLGLKKANSMRNRPITDWEEWQANVLSSVLLPRPLVEQAMEMFGVQGKIRILNKLFAREDYSRFVSMTELLGCSKNALATCWRWSVALSRTPRSNCS